jgi:hypothetical protein
MILEVTTDTRQMLYDGDAVALQLLVISDARLHEHLGSVDGAEGQHDLSACAHRLVGSPPTELHAGNGAAS